MCVGICLSILVLWNSGWCLLKFWMAEKGHLWSLRWPSVWTLPFVSYRFNSLLVKMTVIVLHIIIYYSYSILLGPYSPPSFRTDIVSLLAVPKLGLLVRGRKSSCGFCISCHSFFLVINEVQFWIFINVHKPCWKAVFQKRLFWCKITADFHLISRMFAECFVLPWKWSFKSFNLILHYFQIYFRNHAH